MLNIGITINKLCEMLNIGNNNHSINFFEILKIGNNKYSINFGSRRTLLILIIQ